jgi:hypothetical protein
LAKNFQKNIIIIFCLFCFSFPKIKKNKGKAHQKKARKLFFFLQQKAGVEVAERQKRNYKTYRISKNQQLAGCHNS